MGEPVTLEELDVDHYFPPGDMNDAARRLHADAVAALDGLRRAELRANRRPEALELLVPQAHDWVASGTNATSTAHARTSSAPNASSTCGRSRAATGREARNRARLSGAPNAPSSPSGREASAI